MDVACIWLHAADRAKQKMPSAYVSPPFVFVYNIMLSLTSFYKYEILTYRL